MPSYSQYLTRFYFILLLTGLHACITSDPIPEPLASPDQIVGDLIVLGEKLENPYSLTLMLTAYEKLKSKGIKPIGPKPQATHYYIRFLPASVTELDSLSRDTTLELFDHPLDYAIAKIGDRYHDPSIPSHLPTWQYTAVPIDFDFPNVRYEILETLHLGPQANKNQPQNSDNYTEWQLLQDEALRLTGQGNNGIQERTEGWRPSGRIRVEEYQWSVGRTGVQPLRYCKVRARNWFQWASTYTAPGTGYFNIPKSFRGPVHYSLQFTTAAGSFKVTTALGILAQHNGPTDSREDWFTTLRFWNDQSAWYRATTMNAIYHYRQQALRHRVRLPGAAATIKVYVHFTSGRSNALGVIRHITLLPFSDVQLYTRDVFGNRYTTDVIYRTIMHELAHVSHFLRSPDNAIACGAGMTGESWAVGVEYIFTNYYYPSIALRLPDRSRSQITNNGEWRYTPFYIDLQDKTNQRALNNGSSSFAQDRVQGYTLYQMHTAMAHSVTLNGMVQYLKKNYTNSTEDQLDELVEFYNDIKNNH